MNTPNEIVDISIKSGVKKVNMSTLSKLLLGFVAGAMVALGYLTYVKVTATMDAGMSAVVGGAVFPVGLIIILLGGGELITGNIMTVGIAFFDKKVSGKQLIENWVFITFANFLGGLFVAYFFGHIVGLTEGDYSEYTRYIAQAKVSADFLPAFVSGIGCNWMVCLAVWLCYGAKDSAGKILGAWFPTMAFVAIGFQHSVANMFIIPAAIFGGASITWFDMLQNFIPVYLGNIVGGSIMVAGIYYVALKKR